MQIVMYMKNLDFLFIKFLPYIHPMAILWKSETHSNAEPLAE